MSNNNALRWDCKSDGCFNTHHRPKLEVFYDCFPGKIAMGDVDGIVEVNSNFLIMEYKSHGRRIPQGQHIMYSRLTRVAPVTVWVINGDCQTMDIRGMSYFYQGKVSNYESMTLEDLKLRVVDWVSWAMQPK